MKVTNQGYVQDPGQGKATSAKVPAKHDFSQLLDKAMEKGQALVAAHSPAAASPVSVINAADPSSLYRQLDGLINALDNYCNALGDSKLTLRQVQPLAQEMEAQADKLQASLKPDQADSLTGLAREAIMRAKVEGIKFRRGDYV